MTHNMATATARPSATPPKARVDASRILKSAPANGDSF